ncbi:hypothetical protein YPPY94_4066, partial [Yersinia pestis PY-94]
MALTGKPLSFIKSVV